jgi:hypothetical protein
MAAYLHRNAEERVSDDEGDKKEPALPKSYKCPGEKCNGIHEQPAGGCAKGSPAPFRQSDIARIAAPIISHRLCFEPTLVEIGWPEIVHAPLHRRILI